MITCTFNFGNNVFPIGADDTHADVMVGGAWIMVGAKELTYDSVIYALEKGDLYMSCGPEIHSVYVEGNKLKVTCSDARKVCMLTHGRFARSVPAKDGLIRSAEFDLTYFLNGTKDDPNAYVCVMVIAQDGSYAVTPAYYLKEYEQAAQSFENAAEQPGKLQQDAWFNLGNTYYRAQNKDKAVAAYKQAILQNPQDKEAIHNLQLVLQQQQNQQNQNNFGIFG